MNFNKHTSQKWPEELATLLISLKNHWKKNQTKDNTVLVDNAKGLFLNNGLTSFLISHKHHIKYLSPIMRNIIDNATILNFAK